MALIYCWLAVAVIAGVIKLCDETDLSARQVAARRSRIGTMGALALFVIPMLYVLTR